jgi:peroxiredoxin
VCPGSGRELDQGIHRRDEGSEARPWDQGLLRPATFITRRSNDIRNDIAPGGSFPDYELTDHTKVRRRLSELQGNDPMILVLSRGHFCPKDHQQHFELAAFYPKISVAYTRIVTVSTDNIVETREFRASVGAEWTFLSDVGRKVQKDLDIQEYTDPYHDPMIPHTLVLKPGLVIHSVYNGYWFWGRPSIEDLRRDLREVSCEIRPDWELSKPGLRTAWEAGDRTQFFSDPDVQPASARRPQSTTLDQVRSGSRPTAPRAAL